MGDSGELEEYIGWLLRSSQKCLHSNTINLLLDAVLDQINDVERDYTIELDNMRILVPSTHALNVWANILHIYCFDDYMLEEAASKATSTDVNVVIDAGAFIGLTALKFASQYPNARIVAVEPNPYIVDYLRLNIEMNRLSDRVVIERAALASKSGQGVLFVPKDSPVNASLYKEYAVKYSDGDVSTVYVKLKTLDDIVRDYRLNRVDVLKLDIEGEEANVVEYAVNSGILRRMDVKMIIVEVHREDDSSRIAGLLKREGYLCRLRWLSGTEQWVVTCIR